jgi:three-Cys-motif partner protein
MDLPNGPPKAPSFPLLPHRVKPGTEGRDWLDAKLAYLTRMGAPFTELGGSLCYEAGAWGVLKLIGLLYAHDVYLSIMSKQRAKERWSKLFYVDLNAATGLVRVGGSNRKVAGSAIIAANNLLRSQGQGYDHAIFVEPSTEACQALDARLGSVLNGEQFTILNKTANEAVPEILEALGTANAHYLSLFDPFGFQQGDWNAYGRLLSSTERGDMLIAFQTAAAKRAGEQAFAQFIGKSVPGLMAMAEEDVLSTFEARLGEFRGAVGSARIKAGPGHGRYYYDLVYAAARTWNRNPFMNAFRDLERKLAGMTGTAVESVLVAPPLSHYDGRPE